MMNIKRNLFFYLLFMVFVYSTSLLCIDLFAQENIRQKVEEALKSPSGDTAERLAELGKPAVPLLLEILRGNEFPEYKFPATIVDSLGMIGDIEAVPGLLEMLEKEECQVSESIIIAAFARIGDPAAESAVLSFFEEKQSENSEWQLEAAYYLLKVGGETSRQKVKEMVSYVRDLYERSGWTFDEETQKEIFKELRESPFYNEEIVYAFLADLIINLKDTELITKAIKYRQLVDETGPRFTEGFKVLAEAATPETLEIIFKFAENSEEVWPPAPAGLTEEQRREFSQVPPLVRIAAVETLVQLGTKVPQDRVKAALGDLVVEGFIVASAVRVYPARWNLNWYSWVKKYMDEKEWVKRFADKVCVLCMIGNLEGGYTVEQILPETIRLNGEIPVQPWKEEKLAWIWEPRKKKHPFWGERYFKGWRHHRRSLKGFEAPVMLVRFNKYKAMESLLEMKPREKCTIAVTGKLEDGKTFIASTKIKIVGWNRSHKWDWRHPDWLNCDKDIDNWWNKNGKFDKRWKRIKKGHKNY